MKLIKDIIKNNHKGRFFTVKFIKKDGTKRVMLCKVRTKKGGKLPTTAHIEKYIVLWSVNDKKHKNVNTDTLYYLRMDGVEMVIT